MQPQLAIAILIFYLVNDSKVYLSMGCGMDCFGCGPRDCRDVQALGFTISGVFHVTPAMTFTGYDVYCDLETAQGGWLVFQRRQDGSINFNKTWDDYEIGFGDKTGEHWLGNAALYAITSQGLYELWVELEDWEGNQTFARYRNFQVGSAKSIYELFVSGYSGNAGDSLSYHSGQVFSTFDKEATKLQDGQPCAAVSSGAWWYAETHCHYSNLNGLYWNGTHDKTLGGRTINWETLTSWFYSLKKTEMKIRRI